MLAASHDTLSVHWTTMFRPLLPPAGLLPRIVATAFTALVCCAPATLSAATNLSVWVRPGEDGRLIRRPDTLGNRLLDYSMVGYGGGTVPLPEVAVKATRSPGAGDDGAAIQAAIDQVSALPLGADGFRGAVLLAAGEYQIAGTLRINASGVVLRGAGDGTNGTILRATGTGQRSLIQVGGSGSASTVNGTTHAIAEPYVPVGAISFLVDSTAGLAVGDRVMVRRNANAAWIQALGMDQLCCAPDVNPWSASSYSLDFDRVIARIEGKRITLDAPITCAIEERYGGGTIRKFTWSGRIRNVGVEHLRGESDHVSATDEDHAWIFVQFNKVEDAWARKITARHFGFACVAFYAGTRRATALDCSSLEPRSQVTGGRRYAFVMDDCQLALVRGCRTQDDRHQFVTQSLTTGPNVFVDGVSDSARSDAGPHHRWATGALWDNITVNGHALNVQNRGNLGSGHGWAGGNCVVWNSGASGGFVVQNPPTARNWLIGSTGAIRNGTVHVGPHDPGTYDSHGTNVFPNSLYVSQVQDRLSAPSLETREYRLGDIDGFDPSVPTGDPVGVDAAWRTAVIAATGDLPGRGFDALSGIQCVPFTFDFQLATNERVVSAELHLALRAGSPSNASNRIFIDATTNPVAFSDLGWIPLGTGTNTVVRTLDLNPHLSRLADGRLNLAVQGDVAIDWAMLDLRTAPLTNTTTQVILPAADAHVRGGASAGANFGSETVLTLKEDSSADLRRRALLRWDLGAVTGEVLHAAIRLTPVLVGFNGLEHCAAVGDGADWSETAVTWGNRPAAGRRFASWIPRTGQAVEIPVTPQVVESLRSGGDFSVELFSLTDAGGDGGADYASREHADASARPQLVLAFAAPPVPATNEWNLLKADVGGADPPGGSGVTNGVLTLVGGGNDISGTADQFHFTHVPLTGDCQVVARVVSLEALNAWTKCGVMIRETLGAHSPHAMTVVTPANGVNFMWRNTSGGTSSHTQADALAAPVYLRVVRTGNLFTSWHSADGSSWTPIGSAQSIPMASVVHAGFCLTSHVVGSVATARLDHVQISRPAPSSLVADGLADGAFRLRIVDPAGPLLLLQSSTNLVHWRALETVRPTGSPWPWTDLASEAADRRFYRVLPWN